MVVISAYQDKTWLLDTSKVTYADPADGSGHTISYSSFVNGFSYNGYTAKYKYSSLCKFI